MNRNRDLNIQLQSFHLCSIFKTQLSLSWGQFDSVVTWDSTDRVSEMSTSMSQKLELSCKFCVNESVFATAYRLWRHLFQKHVDIAFSKRLKEIKNVASLWRRYVDHHEIEVFKTRLTQTKFVTFNWIDVTTWDLWCRVYNIRDWCSLLVLNDEMNKRLLRHSLYWRFWI